MSIIKSLLSRVAVSSLYSTTVTRSSHASLYSTVARSRSSVRMLDWHGMEPLPPNCQMRATRIASPEIQELAKMAVEHHNKKCVTLKRPKLKTLQFVRLVDGYYEFIAGDNFHFVIKVKDESGDAKYVEASIHRGADRHKTSFHSLKCIPDLAVYVPPPHLY